MPQCCLKRLLDHVLCSLGVPQLQPREAHHVGTQGDQGIRAYRSGWQRRK